MIHRENGKRWNLPDRIMLEGKLRESFRYEVDCFRKPRKGEYYLSGNPVQGWKAPNDLDTEFLVLKSFKRLEPVTIWVDTE